MEIATKAARRAARPSFYFRKGCQQSIEDLAGDIVAAYLSEPEWDRVDDELGFEIWCYDQARKLRVNYVSRDVLVEDGLAAVRVKTGLDLADEAAFDLIRSGSVARRQRPMQELHMEVLDVLRYVSRLPKADATLVLSIVDYGDITEFAKDRNVSLYDAMNDLRRAREIMKRLREDDDDDGRERAALAEHALENI